MATTSQLGTSSSKEQAVAAYLRDKVQMGECYFKSRFIADDIDLSPKEIGAMMVKIREQSENLDIEKWSYSSGTTWRVTMDQESE